MASIKVKFKPSTVADHEGTIFYQILHKSIRKLGNDGLTYTADDVIDEVNRHAKITPKADT